MKRMKIWIWLFVLNGFLFRCEYDSEDTNSDTDIDSFCNPAWGSWDEDTGLCWQHPASSSTYNWQGAIDYCDSLSLGGHTDWYLPSRQDFVDMLGGCDADVLAWDGEESCEDYYYTNTGSGYCDSCVESDNCDQLFGTDTLCYWTATVYCGDCGSYSVDFDIGAVS